MTTDILFLCQRLPFPPNKGDKIRSHAILTYLAKHYKVHVGCFLDDRKDLEYIDVVRQIAGGDCIFIPLTRTRVYWRALQALMSGQPITASCFYSKRMVDWLETLATGKNVWQAVVFSSAMAPYLLQEPAWDPRQCLLDMVDVDSDKWNQYSATAPWLKRWIYRREAITLHHLERTAARQFGATTLVSLYEAQTFSQLAPESADKICSINNGVDLTYFSPKRPHPSPFCTGEKAIVMTGAMNYPPNTDAAAWFIRQVMPYLKRDLPQARFYVVGANPPCWLCALARQDIVVTGSVHDVRPYLQHAAVVVAPLRIARGVQNKVLEAMAMCRPVVATWEATRALDVRDRGELWIENDPFRYAAAVLEAIQSTDRNRIAQNGRRYVEQKHQWQTSLSRLRGMLVKLAAAPEQRHSV